MKPFNDERPKGYCCSGKVNILHVALIVTLLTFAGATYEMTCWSRPILDWLLSDFKQFLFYRFFGILELPVSFRGIYAYRQRVAWAWLPVAVYHGIEAAFLVVIGGVYLLLSVAYLGPHVSLDAFKEESEDIVVEHRFAAALAAAHVLCALLSVCVTTIAYQAYKRQKREDKQVLKNYDSVKAAF